MSLLVFLVFLCPWRKISPLNGTSTESQTSFPGFQIGYFFCISHCLALIQAIETSHTFSDYCQDPLQGRLSSDNLNDKASILRKLADKPEMSREKTKVYQQERSQNTIKRIFSVEGGGYPPLLLKNGQKNILFQAGRGMPPNSTKKHGKKRVHLVQIIYFYPFWSIYSVLLTFTGKKSLT